MKYTPMQEKNQNNDSELSGRIGLVYARVSSIGQANYGGGLESQESRCIRELKNLQIPHVKTFSDSFTGGGDFMKRPAMSELLAYVDSHPHQKFLIVFDDLKRFARDVEFHLKLRAALRYRNVALRCLNYTFDESPEGVYTELIMAGHAQLERQQNRRQVIQKQRARMESGHWSLAAKKGYTRNPVTRILQPNNLGLTMLKPALEGFATGNLIRKIDVCRFLVESGFWNKQRPEKYIHRIDSILRDPFFCGDIEYKRWDVTRRKGQHDGIISSEIYEKIQRRLSTRGATARVRKDISDEFPLRGLVLCSCCLNPLTAANTTKKNGKKFPYYYCQHKDCEKYASMIRKQEVEDNFRHLLHHNYLRKDVSKIVEVVFDRLWTQESIVYSQHKQGVEHRKKDLQVEIAELSQLARRAQSEAVQRGYEAQMERVVNELDNIHVGGDDLDIPYRTALNKVSGLLKNPLVIWDNVDTLERHRLFFFLFEEKLPYTKNIGYRTANSVSNVRLFEEFAVANPHLVEMGGIEPPSKKRNLYESTRCRSP
ncbi:MAG: Resolvase-like protein [Candidatus Kaiserbacteria bacterium]|nr:Resolvase-like protein [Candidatus Kaiserbacteria bacterium]